MTFWGLCSFIFLSSLADSLIIDNLTPKRVAQKLSIPSFNGFLRSLDARHHSNLENFVKLIRCERYDFLRESDGLGVDQLKLLLEQGHGEIISELVTAGYIGDNPEAWDFVLANIQALEPQITGENWFPDSLSPKIRISLLQYMLKTQVPNISSYEWCSFLDTDELEEELLADDLWELYPSHCLVKIVLADQNFLPYYITRIGKLDDPLPGLVRLALLSSQLSGKEVEHDYDMVEQIQNYLDSIPVSNEEIAEILEILKSMTTPMEGKGVSFEAVQLLHPLYTQSLIGKSWDKLPNNTGFEDLEDGVRGPYAYTASTFEFEFAEFIFQHKVDLDTAEEYARGLLSRYRPSQVSPFMQKALLQHLNGLDHYQELRCGEWPETFSPLRYPHLPVPFIPRSKALSSWRRRIFRMQRSYKLVRLQSFDEALNYFTKREAKKRLLPLYHPIDYEEVQLRPKDLALSLINSMIDGKFLAGSLKDGLKFYCDIETFSLSSLQSVLYAMMTLLASDSMDRIPLIQELLKDSLLISEDLDFDAHYEFLTLSPDVCIQPTEVSEKVQAEFIQNLMHSVYHLIEKLDVRTLVPDLGILYQP